jgi:hypothetical protein
MRFIVELRYGADGVEGEVTEEGTAQAQPFVGWLELLRLLEAPSPPGLPAHQQRLAQPDA